MGGPSSFWIHSARKGGSSIFIGLLTPFFNPMILEWRGTPPSSSSFFTSSLVLLLFGFFFQKPIYGQLLIYGGLKKKRGRRGGGPSSFWNHIAKEEGLVQRYWEPTTLFRNLISEWRGTPLRYFKKDLLYKILIFHLLPLQGPCRRSLNKVCSCFTTIGLTRATGQIAWSWPAGGWPRRGS